MLPSLATFVRLAAMISPHQPSHSDRADLEQYGTWERQVSGQWHLPAMPETAKEHQRTFALTKQLNELGNTDDARAKELLKDVLAAGSGIPGINTPLNLEYGCNLSFGEHCFVNFNAVILAQASVTFGDHCMVGPNCSFITITHPVNDHEMRKGGWEIAKPITVGDNTWFGANCTVLPGVTIGSNCVIGAGALVTKDIPDNSLVLGSPARVVRELPDAPASSLERAELDGPVEGFASS